MNTQLLQQARVLDIDEQIELLDLQQSGIRVAEYLTELPPLPVLKNKLHEVINTAREQVARRKVTT
jgi:hypothetical protein